MALTAPDPSAEAIARAAVAGGFTIGVAESLTGGLLSNRLAVAPDASVWFRGGVVAYSLDVKQKVLGVSAGPVVTERCAREMAAGAAGALGADVTVAVTGVGGPDPEEGQPAGTVWFAVSAHGRVAAEQARFDGGPAEVCDATCQRALDLVLSALSGTRTAS